ncbi:MAG: Tex family protein [Gemmataceae bacterium]
MPYTLRKAAMSPSEPTPNPSEPILSHTLAVEEKPSEAALPVEVSPAEVAAPVELPKPERPSQPVPLVPPAPQPHDLSRIAQDLQIRKAQVEAVVKMLDDEHSVPFIARFRKEATGGLPEEAIRRIQERVRQLRQLADRKQTILKSIAYHGKLTEDLTQAILAADFPKRLEDLYLPFKPKKKSKATEAREKGLAPLAEAIWHRDPAVAKLDEVLPGLVDPDKWLLNTDEVLAGVREILAEMVADSADVRGPLRNFIWDVGLIASNKVETLPEGKGKEFDPYASFKEPVKEIPPHRVLAINRGEKTNILRVHLDIDRGIANEIATFHLNLADHPHRELLTAVTADSLERLVLPSLEREVRRELTERAQDHAIHVFARNLRSLLLQPPLRGKKVLAIDPGIRTGCKLAVLDEAGKPLDDAVIYPHGQRKNAADSKRRLEQLVRKHQVDIIAIGNGAGCRETEQLVAELISDLEHRRLIPTPSVPAVPPPAPAAEVPPIAAPDTVTHTEAPAPALPEGTFVSDPVMPVAGMSFTSDVHVPPPETTGVETTGAAAPTSETVTTGSGVIPVPAAPPVPEISLEGLPDAPPDLAYVIVIEAGASDYSASPVAREEFPNLDATTRGTISIGRRLQDPLAELVKIEPQHIGVGLYQHDVRPKHLKESLEAVIESSVNQVGVDVNSASVPLLRHVSGLNMLTARAIYEHRERHGPFKSREEIAQVAGLGEKRYAQAAGFLKIADSPDPLDGTWIHPESYPVARQILTDLGFEPNHLRDAAKLEELRARLRETSAAEASNVLKVGEPTIRDIFEALANPGRDPREDLPPPIFKKGVLKIEDITPGMELKGTVLNVVPFGAFVDIGLKESGLVHISQMANRYIKSPYDVVAVGDVVTVWVIDVKGAEKKISLSMIQPGQERRAERDEPRGERPPREPRRDRGPGPGGPPREQRGERQGPPRGDRGPRPGGRGPGGPPREPRPAPSGPVDLPPPPPPKPVRPPRPPKPLPKLTGDKKTGKAALNTFAELAAFFKPDEPEKAPEPPKAEEPKTPEPPKPE